MTVPGYDPETKPTLRLSEITLRGSCGNAVCNFGNILGVIFKLYLKLMNHDSYSDLVLGMYINHIIV